MRWYYLSNFRGDKIYGIVRCNNIMEDFYQKLSRMLIFHGDIKDSKVLRQHASLNIKNFY